MTTTKASTEELLEQALARIDELELVAYETAHGVAAMAGRGFWRRSPLTFAFSLRVQETFAARSSTIEARQAA